MGSFKLGGMTFGSLFKKPETVLYPFEQKPAPAGLKGHIENDASACILCGTWAIDPFRCVQCGTCVRVCPKHCLTMDPAYTPIATAKSCRVVHVPDPKAAVTES